MFVTTKIYRIIFINFLIFGKICLIEKCNHNPTSSKELITGVTDSFYPESKRLPFSNIIIHMEYLPSFNEYVDSNKIKKQIITPAVNNLESMIKVKNPMNGILRLARKCTPDTMRLDYKGNFGCAVNCHPLTTCGEHIVPNRLLKRCKIVDEDGAPSYKGKDGEGIYNVDIIILIGSEGCLDESVAFGGSCQLEKDLDRPILSYITLCLNKIDVKRNIFSHIAIIEHEIIHALGFSEDRYAFFRYTDGNPIVKRDVNNLPSLGVINGYYKWSDDVIKNISRVRYNIHDKYEIQGFGFVLPNILKVTREHFNCPSLDAVDLDPNSLSHLNEYVFFNEIMTSESNDGYDQISKFSLALLKDTGWYDVDYTKVHNYYYGENKGCSFILNGCYRYMEDQRAKNLPIFPFCDKVYKAGNIYKCTDDKRFYYFCNIIRHATFDKKYEYFKKLDGLKDFEVPFYGGSSRAYEYCPSMSLRLDSTSICADESNRGKPDYQNILESYYGPDSLCFENDIRYHDPNKYYGASCQKYYYNRQKKKLKIFFSDKTVECPSNQIYLIKGIKDVRFKCPDLKNFDNITIITTDKHGMRYKEIWLGTSMLYSLVITYYVYVI